MKLITIPLETIDCTSDPHPVEFDCSDDKITRDIAEQLHWDNRLDASNIIVTTQDGMVTLVGTVTNYPERQAASDVAWGLRGVDSVINNITVKHPLTAKTPIDAGIKSKIRNVLNWNPNIDASNINVSVDAGHVTLEGTIDALWKKIRAERLASKEEEEPTE